MLTKREGTWLIARPFASFVQRHGRDHGGERLGAQVGLGGCEPARLAMRWLGEEPRPAPWLGRLAMVQMPGRRHGAREQPAAPTPTSPTDAPGSALRGFAPHPYQQHPEKPLAPHRIARKRYSLGQAGTHARIYPVRARERCQSRHGAPGTSQAIPARRNTTPRAGPIPGHGRPRGQRAMCFFKLWGNHGARAHQAKDAAKPPRGR